MASRREPSGRMLQVEVVIAQASLLSSGILGFAA